MPPDNNIRVISCRIYPEDRELFGWAVELPEHKFRRRAAILAALRAGVKQSAGGQAGTEVKTLQVTENGKLDEAEPRLRLSPDDLDELFGPKRIGA